MKKEFENIEQLFKDSFENYEANVDASVWNNIQQSINSPASSAASSSSAGNAGGFAAKSAFFKITAATITSAVVVTSSVLIYNVFKDEPINTNEVAENQVTTENLAPQIIEEKATETSLTTENNTTENESNVVTPQQNEVKDKELISNEKNNISNTINNNNTTETTTTPTNTVVENNKETQTQSTVVTNTNTNTPPTQPSTTNTPKVDVLANVSLKASTKKGDAPLYVEFNVVGEAADYQWNVDGTTKSGENMYHTFDNPGKYEVLLTVKDKYGKTKTITENIEVLSLVKSSISDIQNIFTPNGDGANDILKVEGENIKEFKAVVYNQNGTVVFEWNTISGFWDGKDMNNQSVPDGTYFLVVNALGEDNQPYEFKKSVTLRK